MKKGILLAGGHATRLYPATRSVSKHLLPIYDKPMIYYSLSTLMLAGIRNILIISTPQFLPLFKTLLKDGSQWGCDFEYEVQRTPKGIADALVVAENFAKNEQIALMLGDNLFYGAGFSQQLKQGGKKHSGATIFAYHVDEADRYGVLIFEDEKVKDIVEKPKHVKQGYAVPGLYFYDEQAVDIAKTLKPSARGELEITDVHKEYLKRGQLHVEKIPRGTAWLDAGTPEALHQASELVRVMQTRRGLKIGCVEEVAYREGYISKQKLLKLAETCGPNHYAQYLRELI